MMMMRTVAMWMMGLLTVALAVVLVGVFDVGTASATENDSRIGAAQGQAGTGDGSGFGSAVTPVIAADQEDLLTVWSATLTVGEVSDSTRVVKGFGSRMDPVLGGLSEVRFSDRGAEYTVETLVHQQVGSVHQLVLEVDAQLPDDMVFKVGDERFNVSDATILGMNEDIHAWWLESGMGWSEGDTVAVELKRPLGLRPSVAEATEAGVGIRFREVWSAILTVGKAAGEESGVHGYASGGLEEFGALDDTTFTDGDTHYSVGRLVHKVVGGKYFLLYLEPGHALDPNMVFEVDGERYAVLDSSPQKGDETTHGWLLDSSLGWEEGDTMTVKMLKIELYVRGSEGQALAHAGG